MKVMGTVLVENIVTALDIEALPEGCRFAETDTIDLDDVEVDDDLAAEELPESYFPDGELHDLLDETTVFDLSAAIRRGDQAEAEYLLDRLVRDDDRVKEWVERGRYSRAARARPSRQALRDAA